MKNEELQFCLTGIKNGDMAAFEKLYQNLKTPAYTVIFRITRDEAASEDILQNLFLKLYNNPPDGDIKNPRAYILKSAHNMAVDSVKSRYPMLSLDEIGYVETASQQYPELKLDIEEALNSLNFTEKRIVTLHINGGLTFRETADIVDMPLGTVLWRYQRAMSKLRVKLSGGAI